MFKNKNFPIKNYYLGSRFKDSEIERALKKNGFKYLKSKNFYKIIAKAIVRGKIIARFDGKMEYGPRALCNRSILYMAKDKNVNTWLNNKLGRTEFMPFAPVLFFEDAKVMLQDFDDTNFIASKYMTITYKVTNLCKKIAPAVVHIDGTARPQIIEKKDNKSMYKILSEFKKLNKYSIMVNTSFNMHEEPIVRTPSDAIRAVLKSDIDILSIGEFVAYNNKVNVQQILNLNNSTKLQVIFHPLFT